MWCIEPRAFLVPPGSLFSTAELTPPKNQTEENMLILQKEFLEMQFE